MDGGFEPFYDGVHVESAVVVGEAGKLVCSIC